uniref:G_PROTEIN_RECEP_F1_2 domain-containing protein n=1 Tax=Heterorhabditis bacteriophora TaxID=37862 RepID=A0A1I7W7F3_HETBA
MANDAYILYPFFTISSTVLPFIMLLMYCFIFACIIKKKNITSTASSTEKDRSLLWQAVAVTFTLEVSY